jgi:hypothetical protein
LTGQRPGRAEEDIVRPSFSRVWKEITAAKLTWDTRSILLVPKQHPSLVMVRHAAGHPVTATGLAINPVSQQNVPTAIEKYLSAVGVTGAHRKALTKDLWTAIDLEMKAGGVLLSVQPQKVGAAWLYAGKVKQQVAVVEPVYRDVGFKFLHHLNGAGVMAPATSKEPKQVDDWIADLNWILGAQANIWFEKSDFDPIEVNQVLAKPVGDAVLRSHLVSKRDPLADVTVYLVGKWKGKAGGDAAGTYFPDLNVIAVDDNPAIPMVPGSDQFTVVLAHELVHYMLHQRGYGSLHISDQHALLNDKVESSVIVPDLQWKLTNNK